MNATPSQIDTDQYAAIQLAKTLQESSALILLNLDTGKLPNDFLYPLFTATLLNQSYGIPTFVIPGCTIAGVRSNYPTKIHRAWNFLPASSFEHPNKVIEALAEQDIDIASAHVLLGGISTDNASGSLGQRIAVEYIGQPPGAAYTGLPNSRMQVAKATLVDMLYLQI
ncbi:MAG: hypothetical protein ABIJ34_08305 [archaeon]